MSAIPYSLKALVFKGSIWVVAGHGAGQLIRLLSNVILTRLLFPEAFGIISLVWVVMYGLEMLSDVGVASAIIRDKRGDDPDFLNTAWTLQVIRGAALWGVSFLIAGPMASFYGQPLLAQLIPVAGLTAILGGCSATALHTCRRHMEFGRVTLLELVSQIVSSAAAILWAYLHPTVWAFVGGALIGKLFVVVASHACLPGIRNRFRLEHSSMHVLISFGKWIFLSSAFHFLSVQSDRLLLGHYLSMTEFGVYGIAIMLIEAIRALVLKVNHGVLFPAYGKIVLNEPERLRPVSHRARLAIDIFLILPLAMLMILGSWVVEGLYDARYHDAGWMLQILCLQLLMTASLSNSEACLVALGHPQYAFMQNVCRAIWILLGIPIGWSLGGVVGVIWVVALFEIPVIMVFWTGLIRHRLFSVFVEFRSLLFIGFGVLSGYGILHLLP